MARKAQASPLILPLTCWDGNPKDWGVWLASFGQLETVTESLNQILKNFFVVLWCPFELKIWNLIHCIRADILFSWNFMILHLTSNKLDFPNLHHTQKKYLGTESTDWWNLSRVSLEFSESSFCSKKESQGGGRRFSFKDFSDSRPTVASANIPKAFYLPFLYPFMYVISSCRLLKPLYP